MGFKTTSTYEIPLGKNKHMQELITEVNTVDICHFLKTPNVTTF